MVVRVRERDVQWLVPLYRWMSNRRILWTCLVSGVGMVLVTGAVIQSDWFSLVVGVLWLCSTPYFWWRVPRVLRLYGASDTGGPDA
jgi:hypothetical protein